VRDVRLASFINQSEWREGEGKVEEGGCICLIYRAHSSSSASRCFRA